MANFTVYNETNAPSESRDRLEETKEDIGFIPNLIGVLAESPSAIDAYLDLGELLADGELNSAEIELLYLTVSEANDCGYCVAAHTWGSGAAGLDEKTIDSVRNGNPVDDPKLEALRSFANELVIKRGKVAPKTVSRFLDAGYNKAAALEVIVGVAQKTLSNYVDHAFGVELDDELAPFAWGKDDAPARATA